MQPMFSAAQAAAPEDEPPGVRSSFQGLRVIPLRGESPSPFQPNSGMQVLPRNTAPASRSRATAGASSSAGALDVRAEPLNQVQPFTAMLSFTVAGTPSSGPHGSPAAQRASEARAIAIVSASFPPQNALM